MKDILLITPPFTQLNTPYPATAYLKGFLSLKGIISFQMDLGIEVINKLFSAESLKYIFDIAFQNKRILSKNTQRIYSLRDKYIVVIEPIILFLQGQNQTFARQICTEGFLPEASRFDELDDLEYAFGIMGLHDKAKHLATLYLEDLSDFIVECVDENFGFSRYAERLGRSANSFDELYEHLQAETSFIDDITLQILDNQLNSHRAKIVGFAVPFPGNLYSAFRCAQFIKANYPDIKIVMGGGFPTTELRTISDSRVFDYFDYITLDDGELPLELIVSNLLNSVPNVKKQFKRTFLRENGKVVYNNSSTRNDYKQSEFGTPDYSDLLLDKYISVIEMANPMHSLWSDGRWNKLIMAHGCYWGKCTFCDVSLDYIKLYEPNEVSLLVDRMEVLILRTGETGFHFVDEAAPPALMKAIALEIIRRKLSVTWWTNIRFEKSFTADVCKLLKTSGCVAVSGGLEVASDRLLKLINKGVTVEQVAKVASNFTEAGIMVHAYLMYGFPSQTAQETIDSLEMVRQMFELNIVQSGFWHQFALTAHSAVGLNPAEYGIIPELANITFANNDIQFKDKTGIKHQKFSYGLKKSLFNFMHGIGFDFPLHDWFDFKTPKTTIDKDFILNSIENEVLIEPKATAKLVWMGSEPIVSYDTRTKKGKTRQIIKMQFHDNTLSVEISMDKDKGEWFIFILNQFSIYNNDLHSFAQLKAEYEKQFDEFEHFWNSKPMNTLRENGLLVL